MSGFIPSENLGKKIWASGFIPSENLGKKIWARAKKLEGGGGTGMLAAQTNNKLWKSFNDLPFDREQTF